MTFSEIFQAYYSLYRADSDIPASTDPEYIVGMHIANEAINRWANYDSTYWAELFTTAQTEHTGAVVVVSTGVKTYAAPTQFKKAGGFVRVLRANGYDAERYPIVEPHEVQNQSVDGTYAYFTKAVAGTYTLHLNPAPDASLNGLLIEYDYYKIPTLFTTGSSTTEMSDPYFIVHRMLSNQFRSSRNPYYQSAKADAEDSLRMMQLENNSGTWTDPPTMEDTSNTSWGS